MASYGGYSKTSYGTQGGEDGGGFLGGSQQGSQSQGGSKGYDDETLRPLTIKQLNDWREPFPGADMSIDGAPVTQVTIVGQVRNVDPQTTCITYRLDDGTGMIEVKHWVDPDGPDAGNAKFEIDQYVRVLGRVRSFNGKSHVGTHFMHAVEDYNEVNYHLLEAAYVHLYLTKGPAGGQQQAGAAGGDAAGESMFVDGYGGAGAGGSGGAASKLVGLSRNAQAMYNFLQNAPGGNEGVHLNVICSNTGLSVRDVVNAAGELEGQGMIYTTMDDETWAVLESYG